MAPGRGRRAHAGRTRHRRQRQPLGPLESSPFPFSYSYTNNLFIHDQASDVSLVRADATSSPAASPWPGPARWKSAPTATS
ncbi:hypothetical protein WJ968_34205 [Achromobacter xylosoxidans]